MNFTRSPLRLTESSQIRNRNQRLWALNDLQQDCYQYKEDKCMDRNCHLKVGQGIFNKVIINVERYWKEKNKVGKICDFLIICYFDGRKKLVIVELKNRSTKVREVYEKMDNFCNSILEFVKESSLTDFDFYPILLSKGIPPNESKILKGLKKISLRNHAEKIISERCGVSLIDIFRRYG